MSRINTLTLTVLACAAACLTGTVFLIYLYKQGMPYEFWPSIGLAMGTALVMPLAAVQLSRHTPLARHPGAGFYVFFAVSLLIAIAFGVVTF